MRIEGTSPSGAKSVGTGFFFHFRVDDSRSSRRSLPTNTSSRAALTDSSYCTRPSKVLTAPFRQAGPVSQLCSMRSRADGSTTQDSRISAQYLSSRCDRKRPPSSGRRECYYCMLDKSHIPDDRALADLRALEEVSMVGYPIGLWDEANNLPILRRGTTATHPAIDFGRLPRGIVDIACFPGSSGSPVMILDEGELRHIGNGRRSIGSNRLSACWTYVCTAPIPSRRLDSTIPLLRFPRQRKWLSAPTFQCILAST